MNLIKLLLLQFVFCVGPLTAIETIEPGVLKVAVTDIPSEGENAPGWTLEFLREFERTYQVKVEFVVTQFDHSWSLASEDRVDLVATGVTILDERRQEGMTFSNPYLQVKRGLRIHRDQAELFKTIYDFEGYRVGAVKGMTAHEDLINRAPQGVEIVAFDSWSSMYESFYDRTIQAVAEGYYVSVNSQINHTHEQFPMIDDHDLFPNEPEYLAFAVRNKSFGLLESVNKLLSQKGFPIQSEWKKA